MMDPGTIIAVIELTGNAVSVIWKYYSSVKNAQEDIRRLKNELEAFQETLQKLQQLTESAHAARISTSDSLVKTLGRAQNDVKKLYERLDPGRGRRALQRIGVRELTWPLERNEMIQYVADLEKYRAQAALYLSIDQSSRLSTMEMDQQLSKLPFAEGAPFNSSSQEHEPHCLPDTRVDILQHAQQWNHGSARPIFWLSGLAGTGKSTISRTIARSFSGQGHLAGSFFFRRGRGDLGHAGKFVSTLVRQLTNAQPSLKPFVAAALADNEGLLSQGIQSQWEKLVLRSLENLTKSTGFSGNLKLTFVIDALDECDREDDINLILRLFLQLQNLAAIRFQVFLTSRPEIIIRLGFSSMPEIMHQDLDLDTVPRQIVQHDIKALIDTELKRIGMERNLFDWPEPDVVDVLVEKSELLFIYAATICRFVGDPADLPKERLAIILQNTSSSASLPELDKMYAAILEHSIERNRSGLARDRLVEGFQHVVGSYTVLIDTLSAPSLASLLDLQLEKIEVSFSPLHSLYYVPSNAEDPLRAIHPSFSEFLLDPERCPNRNFNVVPETAHLRLVERCLQILCSSLHRDICQLRLPSTAIHDIPLEKINHYLPEYIQYACLYFVDHLREVDKSRSREVGMCDGGAAHSFFQHNFLNWLETMILMRRLSEGVRILTELVESLIDASKDPELYAIACDARRVLLSNRPIIEDYPLQVYLTPVLFAPKESLIRKPYLSTLPQWIIGLQNGPSELGAASLILESKFHYVKSISFSPDGKFLAAISTNHLDSAALQIWDPSIGELRNTLKIDVQSGTPLSHLASDTTFHLVFSSDSKVLVSAIGDGVISLWDATIGILHKSFQSGASTFLNQPSALWLSPDGNNLAFASSSDKVKLRFWSIETSHMYKEVIVDVTGTHALALSPDGQSLAIGSRDIRDEWTLRFWSASTGLSTDYFEVQGVKFFKLAFSLNGKQLALRTVRHGMFLLDLDTNLLHSLESKNVCGSTFSPDGAYLAGACEQEIRIWDCQTFEPCRILKAQEYGPQSIAFSPDGEVLAIGAGDSTIRLVEVNAMEASIEENSQEDREFWMAISPDSRWIATESKRGLIEVHDVETRALRKRLLGLNQPMCDLVFSFDGKKLASMHASRASNDSTIVFWDLDLNSPDNTLLLTNSESLKTPTLDWSYSSPVSYNGDYLVYKRPGHVLSLWDLTKKPYEKVSVELGLKLSLTSLLNCNLSMDGRKIALDIMTPTLPSRRLVRLIDVKDRTISDLNPDIKGDQLALSPDNRLIATSTFSQLQVWDCTTNKLLHSIMFDFLERLEFSHTGETLKTSSGWIDLGRSSSEGMKVNLSLPGWTIRAGWLEWKGQKVLRLPSDFRSPQACGGKGGNIFIWEFEGRAVFLDLDSNGPTFAEK